ncbi:MAG TPA: hypothetical protein VJ602_01060 [Paludibacter sp.]|nr:hypothetical protein [Paludibacter sp.]
MKRIFQITLLGVFCICSGAFAQVSSSKWQAQSIVIDGNGEDWGTLPRFFNAESNVKYEFRNDAQNLYIILKAADRATQMQLAQAGFSVKLKVKTSPPTKVGITFLASKMGMMPPMQNTQEKLQEKSATNPEFMPKDTATVEGFLFAKGKVSSESNDEKGICFARSKSPRELVTYEIRIPLREIYGNNYALETISKTPVQLQVSINEMSQKNMKKMRGRMGGGMHGGGRGMGGGMPGGGGDMGGGMPGGGEMGEMPGGDMQGEPQAQAQTGFSMERKNFSTDFQLSTGK